MNQEQCDKKIIFHIDVNSAFLSWSAVEVLRAAGCSAQELACLVDPGASEAEKGRILDERGVSDLRTVPSIVGGDVKQRRGIVTAASIPAKKRGVRTAMTVVEAFNLCPELVTLKSDFGLYRIRSRELMDFLRTFSLVLEQLSIDECFMDMTDYVDEIVGHATVTSEDQRLPHEIKTGIAAEKAAKDIKDQVRERFGYTVNIGVSTNKILAKMASDFEKPDKVHTLFPDEIRQKMWPMPVGELFMAGRASAAKLQALGIHTIGDLAKSDPHILESHLKSHGRTLWDYANGRADDEVKPVRGAAKSESVERTLSSDCVDLDDAFAKIHDLCLELAGRLVNHGYRASEVAIIIKFSDFTSATHQRRVAGAIREAADLEREARSLFEEAWDGRPVRLLGVRAGKLAGEGEPVQMSLTDFAREQEAGGRRRKADEAMKSLKERFGNDVIYKGGGGS